MKAVGVLLVLTGSTWIAVFDLRNRRKSLALLQELTAALLEMEASIRWKRQVLPEVIAQQATRPLCGSYFTAVLDGLRHGITLQIAWEDTFSALQPQEAAACLCKVELGGDEAHLMGNLRLAAESLQRLYQELRERQRQEEKLHLAILFSGAGMVIILLL